MYGVKILKSHNYQNRDKQGFTKSQLTRAKTVVQKNPPKKNKRARAAHLLAAAAQLAAIHHRKKKGTK